MNKLSIIIPYRNRAQHLAQFLKHYRPKFPDAEFLVIEQSINKQFNRGLIKNIGCLQSQADYFIFHDVDMLVQGPADYSFPGNPTLFATNASQFGWQMPFPEYFGGVVGFSREHFESINGYSNGFAGWGGEDNELYYRVLACDLEIDRRRHRYLSLPHPRDNPSGFDPAKMAQAKKPRKAKDGLNNCKYKVIGERPIPQGRIITVDL